jgi:putative ABC transport system ATP-binding protein
VIRLESVYRKYGVGQNTINALAGVSVDIERGEFVAVMGPSGSGKSTLMNIIGCLDQPTHGRYLLEGHDVSRLSDDRRARLRSHEFGYVFQSFNLVPRLNAVEQVELPLVYQRARNRSRQAKMALAKVGLADRMRHRPSELSGGEVQRVAIARALVVNPRVVLADEPTGALDTKTGKEVMELFAGLVREQGITIILVTHEAEIAAYADRRITMRDGNAVEDSIATEVTAP